MRDENLTFVMALPPDWQELDLLEPGASEELGVPLANALAFAARGTDQAQLLMLRSLFAVTSAHEPLAAGLCVALADPSAPVSESPLSEDAFAGAEIAGVTLPAGAGLRVKRFVPAMVGDLPVAALQVQYLLQTEHGLLTITLNTPQAAETEDWEHLFDALAATAELR